MADREVPAEEEDPVGPEWAVREEARADPAWVGREAPEWADPALAVLGAAFVPWATDPHPHLPAAAPDGHPGGVAAVACFR